MHVFMIASGPGSDATDAIESVFFHKQNGSALFILNDTRKKFDLKPQWSNLKVFTPTGIPERYKKTKSTYGLLFWKKLLAFEEVQRVFPQMESLIYLDDDALLINFGLEKRVEALTESNPNFGMAGAYKFSARDGSLRDMTPIRKSIQSHTNQIAKIRNHGAAKVLSQMTTASISYGYEIGDHVLGGACVYSREVLESFTHQRKFNLNKLLSAQVADDALMSLASTSLGFKLVDFSGEGDPLSVQWKGLASEPEDLIKQGKMLVHSTDFSESLGRSGVLEYFKNRRSKP